MVLNVYERRLPHVLMIQIIGSRFTTNSRSGILDGWLALGKCCEEE